MPCMPLSSDPRYPLFPCWLIFQGPFYLPCFSWLISLPSSSFKIHTDAFLIIPLAANSYQHIKQSTLKNNNIVPSFKDLGIPVKEQQPEKSTFGGDAHGDAGELRAPASAPTLDPFVHNPDRFLLLCPSPGGLAQTSLRKDVISGEADRACAEALGFPLNDMLVCLSPLWVRWGEGRGREEENCPASWFWRVAVNRRLPVSVTLPLKQNQRLSLVGDTL